MELHIRHVTYNDWPFEQYKWADTKHWAVITNWSCSTTAATDSKQTPSQGVWCSLDLKIHDLRLIVQSSSQFEAITIIAEAHQQVLLNLEQLFEDIHISAEFSLTPIEADIVLGMRTTNEWLNQRPKNIHERANGYWWAQYIVQN